MYVCILAEYHAETYFHFHFVEKGEIKSLFCDKMQDPVNKDCIH